MWLHSPPTRKSHFLIVVVKPAGWLTVPSPKRETNTLVQRVAEYLTKRNRGRRGLDILQRIQKIPNMDVRILEDDFPGIPEVDLKLLELAKRYGCKVVTNDCLLCHGGSIAGRSYVGLGNATFDYQSLIEDFMATQGRPPRTPFR